MKKIIYTILLFFTVFSNANALTCDYTAFTKIKKQATQVNIKTDFEEIDETVTFSITIYNLRPNQYIIDKNNEKRYDYGYNKNNPSEIVIKNIKKSGMYTFEVYSTENECNQNSLSTLYASLPTYNIYYKDKLCKGIETYKLCQRWFGTSITYEQFRNQIAEYKSSLNQTMEEEEEQSFIDYLIELYINNYYIVLPIIIIVLLVPIYIIYQKKYKVDF